MQQQKLSNKKLTQFIQQLSVGQSQLANFISAYIDFKGDKESFTSYVKEINDKKAKEQEK